MLSTLSINALDELYSQQGFSAARVMTNCNDLLNSLRITISNQQFDYLKDIIETKCKYLPFEIWSPFWFIKSGLSNSDKEIISAASIITAFGILIIDKNIDEKNNTNYIEWKDIINCWPNACHKILNRNPRLSKCITKWCYSNAVNYSNIKDMVLCKNPFYKLILRTYEKEDLLLLKSIENFTIAIGLLDDLLDCFDDYKYNLPNSIILSLKKKARKEIEIYELAEHVLREDNIQRSLSNIKTILKKATLVSSDNKNYVQFLNMFVYDVSNMAPFVQSKLLHSLGKLR